MMRKCPGAFPLPPVDVAASDILEADPLERQLIAAGNLVEITHAEIQSRDLKRVLVNDGYQGFESKRVRKAVSL